MKETGPGTQRLGPVLICLSASVLSAAVDGPAGAEAAGATSPAIHCVVVAEVNGSTLVFQGRIFGDRALAGRYSLAASRRGSGTPNVVQSGDFRATMESPATVGTIALGGPGETRATLTVSVGDETVSCDLE